MFPSCSNKNQVLLLILTTLTITACGSGSGSGGGGGQGANSQWLIPERDVQDGGPGVDGIPSIDNPVFESAATITTVDPDDMVIALR